MGHYTGIGQLRLALLQGPRPQGYLPRYIITVCGRHRLQARPMLHRCNMQTNTTTTTPASNASNVAAPASPAPVTAAQVAANVPANAPSKPNKGNGKGSTGQPTGKVFNGATGPKNPVTSQQLFTWLNTVAKGNYSAVQIVCLPNVNPNAACPMPFTNMQKQGKRSNIFWALVKGAPGQGGKLTNNLQAFLLYASTQGASSKNPLDLLAALNGGFSNSAKTYGTPYVKLVYNAGAAK